MGTYRSVGLHGLLDDDEESDICWGNEKRFFDLKNINPVVCMAEQICL